MPDLPEKLALATESVADARRARSRERFPEMFAEGVKIDLERLKRTLWEGRR
jgi:hypothetical protein